MKIIKLLLLFCIYISFSSQAFAQLATADKLRIIVYGNDLVSGLYIRPEQSFGVQLQQKLRSSGFDVMIETFGNPNTTTADAVVEIESIVGKAPDLIILQLGEADIKRRLDPKAIGTNLNNIIEFIKAKNIYVVVMGTKVPPYSGKAYIEEVDGIFNGIKEKTSTYLNPMENIIGNQDMTLGDNYHPNSRGIKFIVDTIYPLVDTGLRWRIKVINELRNSQQTAF